MHNIGAFAGKYSARSAKYTRESTIRLKVYFLLPELCCIVQIIQLRPPVPTLMHVPPKKSRRRESAYWGKQC